MTDNRVAYLDYVFSTWSNALRPSRGRPCCQVLASLENRRHESSRQRLMP